MEAWEPREDSRRHLHSATVSSTSLHSVSHNLRLKRSFRVLNGGWASLSINVRALNTSSLPNQTHRRRRSGPAVTHTAPGSSEMNSSLPLHHRAASWKIQPKWCDLDKVPQQHSRFCFSIFCSFICALFTHLSTRQATCSPHLQDLSQLSIRPESFPLVEKSVAPPRPSPLPPCCELWRALVLN